MYASETITSHSFLMSLFKNISGYLDLEGHSRDAHTHTYILISELSAHQSQEMECLIGAFIVTLS